MKLSLVSGNNVTVHGILWWNDTQGRMLCAMQQRLIDPLLLYPYF